MLLYRLKRYIIIKITLNNPPRINLVNNGYVRLQTGTCDSKYLVIFNPGIIHSNNRINISYRETKIAYIYNNHKCQSAYIQRPYYKENTNLTEYYTTNSLCEDSVKSYSLYNISLICCRVMGVVIERDNYSKTRYKFKHNNMQKTFILRNNIIHEIFTKNFMYDTRNKNYLSGIIFGSSYLSYIKIRENGRWANYTYNTNGTKQISTMDWFEGYNGNGVCDGGGECYEYYYDNNKNITKYNTIYHYFVKINK